jgi:hypothetical protein
MLQKNSVTHIVIITIVLVIAPHAVSQTATLTINNASASGDITDFQSASTTVLAVNPVGLFAGAGGIFGWPSPSSPDTGLSRISPGVVGIGNGGASPTSGTIQATSFQAIGSGGGVATFSATTTNGGIILTPSTDSTAMFQLQQAGGTTFLTADSSNKRLRIGDSSAPTYTLDVGGKFVAGIVGGSTFWGVVQGTVAAGVSGDDVCYGDSSTNVLKCSYNGNSFYPMTQTIGTGTATTNGTAITSLHSQSQPTITIMGATTSDVAQCSLNTAMPSSWQMGIQMLPPVVTANTVTIWLSNPTTANITPAATAVRCTVTR